MPRPRSWSDRLLRLVDSERRSHAPFPPEREDLVEWSRLIPFVVMHLGILAIPWVGVSGTAVAIAVGLYLLRMFAITAFYHRCLSHRAFAVSRPLQFVGALLAASAAQRGPLWWAAHHRRHHRHSDQPADAHSPVQHGFLWSHMGWFTTRRNFRTDLAAVPDLAVLPELRLLDRYDVLAPIGLAALLYVTGALLAAFAPQLGTSGLQLLVFGFCLSTVVVFHATSSINSLAHVFGSRRYPTRDQSRNSFLLALLTLGEGWHNNHHWYPGCARQGFRWWEIDLCYYGLCAMAAVGLVQRINPLPSRVLSSAEATP